MFCREFIPFNLRIKFILFYARACTDYQFFFIILKTQPLFFISNIFVQVNLLKVQMI